MRYKVNQRFENINVEYMGAKGNVDLLLPNVVTSYSAISTIFERKMNYLECTICAKFYSDKFIDV